MAAENNYATIRRALQLAAGSIRAEDAHGPFADAVTEAFYALDDLTRDTPSLSSFIESNIPFNAALRAHLRARTYGDLRAVEQTSEELERAWRAMTLNHV